MIKFKIKLDDPMDALLLGIEYATKNHKGVKRLKSSIPRPLKTKKRKIVTEKLDSNKKQKTKNIDILQPPKTKKRKRITKELVPNKRQKTAITLDLTD